MTVRISIFMGDQVFVADTTLGVERPGPRVVEPSSVSFSAPKAPAKSERIIVDDLGVPPAADDHNGRPSFWGRR